MIFTEAAMMDVEWMEGNLRDDDAAECAALGMSQSAALRSSLENSLCAWVALDAGQPVAIWGVAADGVLGGVGRPWLLTTPGVEQHKRLFMTETRARWATMRTMFPKWENWVDARYERSLRWLRWLGFEIGPVVMIGGYPFHHVTAEA